MAGLASVPKSIPAKTPAAFKALAGSMHRGFDEIADGMSQHAPVPLLLSKLGSLTQNCVACHSAFRIGMLK